MSDSALRWLPYDELLERPEWKAFARTVRDAAGRRCQACGVTGDEARLDVHHHAYDRDRLPWEYDRSELSVLCRPCHRETHEALQRFRKHVFGKMTPKALNVITGALAVGIDSYNQELVASAIAGLMATPASVNRFASDWARYERKPETKT